MEGPGKSITNPPRFGHRVWGEWKAVLQDGRTHLTEFQHGPGSQGELLSAQLLWEEQRRQRGPAKPWMLPARAANSLLLFTREPALIPSRMGIATWKCSSHGCGQQEVNASLGASLLCLQPHLPALLGRSGNTWSSSTSSPLTPHPPAPLPQPPKVSLCGFMGRTFCLQSAVRCDIKRSRKSAHGGLSKPRQMKTFYHNLDLFALV